MLRCYVLNWSLDVSGHIYIYKCDLPVDLSVKSIGCVVYMWYYLLTNVLGISLTNFKAYQLLLHYKNKISVIVSD